LFLLTMSPLEVERETRSPRGGRHLSANFIWKELEGKGMGQSALSPKNKRFRTGGGTR